MRQFTYSVAIRTVGKAGDKFVRELKSLHGQTIAPTHIYVFLAHGFERPKEQVGREEYIDTPKGLVHQRAAANIIEEDFMLIIDDDVYFPPTAVEEMYAAICRYKADGIAPDTFPTQDESCFTKMKAFFANGVLPRSNDGWAIKIQRSGAFSFNNDPPKGSFLPTMSAAGTALFVKSKVWKNIHYEHEQWIDEFPPGTFGEDQLMFYKLYLNHYKLLLWYNSGVLHLDANSNQASKKTYDKLYYRAMSLYLTWYRTLYDLEGLSRAERRKLRLAYLLRYLLALCTRVVFSIMHGSFRFVRAYIAGNKAAKKFVETPKYKLLNPFKLRS